MFPTFEVKFNVDLLTYVCWLKIPRLHLKPTNSNELYLKSQRLDSSVSEASPCYFIREQAHWIYTSENLFRKLHLLCYNEWTLIAKTDGGANYAEGQ